jgi:hypothetical protein
VGEDRIRDAGWDERVTVADAAERLDITKEAVRKRISRGTLRSDKDPDGTVHVYVPSSGTASGTASESIGRNELVELLRAQLEDVRADRDAWREQARRSDYMASAALDRTRELEGRLRELEAPAEPPQEPREAPKAGWLATLVPSPRGRTEEPPADQTGTSSTSYLARFYRWWMQSSLEKYLSYAIGIVLTATATGLDFFYTPGGVDIDVLRLLIAVAFGIYVGIKDGMVRRWGRFNIIGALAGLMTWVVAAYVSEASLIAAFNVGDIDPIASIVVVYFLGTWLMFISGFQLGKALQIKAEEQRGRAQDGSPPSGEHDAVAGDARGPATIGLVGVIVAALLQTLGQIVSAFVGNSGP